MQTDASDVRVGSVGLQQWKRGNNHEAQEQKKVSFLQEKKKSQHHFQFKLSNATKRGTATFVFLTAFIYVCTNILNGCCFSCQLKPKELSSSVKLAKVI